MKDFFYSLESFNEFFRVFCRKGGHTCKISSDLNVVNLLYSYLSFRKSGYNTFFFTFSPIDAERAAAFLDSCFPQENGVIHVYPDEDGPALDRLYGIYAAGAPSFIIAPFEFAFSYIPDKKELFSNVLSLKKGVSTGSGLGDFLTENGYIRNAAVWEQGEFSSRGDITDIFPFGADYPVRIELFGDSIEAIYTFDPAKQEKLDDMDGLFLMPRSKQLKRTKRLMQIAGKNDCIVLNNIELILERMNFLFRQKAVGRIEEPVEQFETITAKRNLIKIYKVMASADFELEISSFGFTNFSNNIELFARNFESWIADNYRIVFFVRNDERIAALEKILFEFDSFLKHRKSVTFLRGDFEKGFILLNDRIVAISERDILEIKKKGILDSGIRQSIDEELKNISPGEYVVHEDYGIGRFAGIVTKGIAGSFGDFFAVEYRNAEKLLLPVGRIYKIHKYISGGVSKPELDTLRGDSWDKKKRSTVKSLEKMLVEVARLYAEREIMKSFPFPGDDEMQKAFEDDFAFEETEDQRKVTEEIKKDMRSEKPMDRLLVGDVGFGKTEIAMRAVFKAVYHGKQAAVLVPTTVLAEQHFITFKERFERYGIMTVMLSRITPKEELKRIIDDISKGRAGIVIGTHRIFSKDISFKDLGLLVIDEEQRFGVKAKERIRLVKKNVHTLTMSATPIPRTLYFSLSQIRPLSLIETAPPGRMPIKTFVSIFNKEMLRAAILEEVKRGGQVFFIHNRIDELEEVGSMLSEMLPGIRIASMHGRKDPREIEETMTGFQEGLYDILVSTTIIEIGIDLPNVNTIIINNGENFGLAQLYQLRGRVGRSYRQAYAYIFVSSLDKMNPDAVKRLSAIKEHQMLGSGYELAVKDMEIRGIGDLFGARQSGNMSCIGLGMYMKILNTLVEKIKKNEKMLEEIDVDIGIMPYIPKEVVRYEAERQRIYLDIINAGDEDSLNSIRERMSRVYSPMPDALITLFDYQWIRIKGIGAGINKIVLKNNALYFRSEKNAEIIHTVLKKQYQLDISIKGPVVSMSITEENIIEKVKNILKNLPL